MNKHQQKKKLGFVKKLRKGLRKPLAFIKIKPKTKQKLVKFRKKISKAYHNLLVFVHLSPLSLAEKCRIAFGTAIVMILTSALFIPYIWMGKLTQNSYLQAEAQRTSSLMHYVHFQMENQPAGQLPKLDSSGSRLDPNSTTTMFIRNIEENKDRFNQLPKPYRRLIKQLNKDKHSIHKLKIDKEHATIYYARIIKASNSCLECHNPQGASSVSFIPNENVGYVFSNKTITGDYSKTIFLNTFWVIIAGLIGGAGAIVAFYVITQRVILRPIRQLRALANNVAEGNLDIRSSIKTRDEYEKLANAFNHMLDGLQQSQLKLREANKQLDSKISELSARNIELFKANKVKGEFLANVSHELRTPMNSILGFAEIIREKPEVLKKEKGKKYAEHIITSGKTLLNMINDLLNLAKSEAGKMELRIEKISILALCEDIASVFSEMTAKKKTKLSLEIQKNIPPIVTDPGKLRQIIYNFVSNAIKFTPDKKGLIKISASMINDNQTLRLAVTDNGCGIAPENQEKIFDKFRQVDASITRQTTGTGLGLAICKELAMLLKANIGLESDLDKGACFWIEMPLDINDRNNPETEPEQS